jgi:threonine/homoserine/homoserine lactone efflux protein
MTEQSTRSVRSLWRVFLHAYLATSLNPKSVLFFVVFVPQFIEPQASLLPQLAAMLTSVLLCGAMVDGSYSLFAASLRRLIRARRTQRAVNRVAGGVLVGERVLAAAWREVAL